MKVAQAQEIFKTTYEPFVHSKTRNVGVKMARNYQLDDRIDPHIDFVSHFCMTGQKTQNSDNAAAVPAKKVARTIRAANNSPFLGFPWAFSDNVQISVIPLCPDASTPTLDLSCGAVSVESLEVSMVSQITQKTLFSGTFTLANQVSECSKSAYCVVFSAANNLPNGAPFFQGAVGKALPPYVPFTVNVFTTYSDGSKSQTSISGAVEGSESASPDLLFSTYSIPKGTMVQAKNNSQAVVEFTGESFNTGDLQSFFKQFNLPDYSKLVQLVHPENNDQTNPGTEGSLDIQAIMGIAQNCPTTFWAQPKDETRAVELWLPWITEVLNQPTVPLVFSVSYSDSEHSGAYNQDYFDRLNTEFMKAGVRGITVIFSSGDDGPFPDATTTRFDPGFPSTSPYVTTVGATQFVSRNDPSCFSGDKYTCTPQEVVCSTSTGAGITSSGGFSFVYPRPSYQDNLVAPYASAVNSLSASNSVNLKGRGFPDISMIGHNVPVFEKGVLSAADGTSASAPFFAGMVALLNDIRLSSGKAPLGFLNPFIYSLDASAFNDVTQGSANCSQVLCFNVGYPAAPGWDAATGRGTPVFSKWAAAVGDLPAGGMPNSASSFDARSIFGMLLFSTLISVLVM
eukprot:Phypoly_transcript_04099.p1 GENE.Phypoly_transcript_04099~~Phypoly_transcript_04099.p1  ORF type:complete len:730 (+),score=114.96 Phypoly_transcript_04099:321-2192(+)